MSTRSISVVLFGALSAVAACGDIQVNSSAGDATSGCTPYCIEQQAYGCNEDGLAVVGQLCGAGTACRGGVCLPDGDVPGADAAATDAALEDAAEAPDPGVDPDAGPAADPGGATDPGGGADPGGAADPGGVADAGGEVCTPDCAGLACGDDGCGGSCGFCPLTGQSCVGGQCRCDSGAATACHLGDLWTFDGCGFVEALVAACDYGCSGGACLPCPPDCTGKACGGDGCGGSCGTCDGGQICTSGACACGAMASTACHQGGVWWFDSCGAPEALQAACEFGCEAGACVGCAPDCAGKACGPDGCGGSCGSCPAEQVCDAGACVCTSQADETCLDGDVWWVDSCGSPETVKEACPYGCNALGCKACSPDCGGKVCGPDGCGGSCGSCGGCDACSQGQCESTCGGDEVCVGASCLNVNGGGCGAGGDCVSGYCDGGVCCDGGDCCSVDADCPWGAPVPDAAQPVLPDSGAADFAIGFISQDTGRVAQTFVAGASGGLARVRLGGWVTSGSGVPLQARVSVRAGATPGAGAVLGEAVVTLTPPSSAYEPFDVVFDPPVPVTAGQSYHLVVRDQDFPPPCGTMCFTWILLSARTGDTYAAGGMYSTSDGGATWPATDGSDLYFETFVVTRSCTGFQCQ